MTINLRLILLFILCLIIAACGFQLRGTVNSDFKSVYIYGGSEGLKNHISKKFTQAGITITQKNPEKTIEILSDKINKRILSLSRSGSVKEFELVYFTSYRFKSYDEPWSDEIKKEISRNYTYDDNNRVAKELEEKNLLQGMRDEIVRAIISQISVTN
jgi:LPS-assembly lipoprotein